MIAQNDNQTSDQFNAGEPVNPAASVSGYAGPSPMGGVLYQIGGRGREWMLVRIGMTTVMPEMRRAPGPMFMAFPTAGGPHPMCPPHHYQPQPSAARSAYQTKARRRPDFINGVVSGEGRPSQKPAPLLRAI